MIEVVKIEDFVIQQIFLPFFNSYTNDGELAHYRGVWLRRLKREPEQIIEMTDKIPGLKERVMQRLKLFGGVEWYRYLDVTNPVIRWVNENLEGKADRMKRTYENCSMQRKHGIAGKDGNGMCLGFGIGEADDGPCETRKKCELYTENEERE